MRLAFLLGYLLGGRGGGLVASGTRSALELGQAAATYKQDLEHGTWELKFPAGVHGIRRATVINSDAVRSAD